MVKSIIPTSEWAKVQPAFVRKGNQYYYLRIQPVESEGMTTSVEELYDHEPTAEDEAALAARWLHICKMARKSEAAEYCKTIHAFEVNGTEQWFAKDVRDGLLLSLPQEQAAGRVNTTLYIGGVGYAMPVAQAITMLNDITLYAVDCKLSMEAHKTAIDALATEEEIGNYDITAGYPAKLTYTLS